MRPPGGGSPASRARSDPGEDGRRTRRSRGAGRQRVYQRAAPAPGPAALTGVRASGAVAAARKGEYQLL